MVRLCLALIPAAWLIAWALSAAVSAASRRVGAFDSPGVAGQHKAERRRVPNTGGVAIFWAIALPMLAGLWLIRGIDASPGADWRTDFTLLPADLHEWVGGIQQRTPAALLLLGAMLWLHGLGLIDDRRPMGPRIKLLVMALPALAVPVITTLRPEFGETRLLTLLDAHVGGAWLSIAVTAAWFLVVVNALNFMDNMDGLAAGVSAIAGACFLAGTLTSPTPQWFVAACLALLVGACLGFLMLNFPAIRGGRGSARLFMGDGGSLVLGFLLAFLTARATYVPEGIGPGVPAPAGAGFLSGHWYAVFMPLVVLAVPLYDFAAVVLIRLRQGRSPFVGDLQHLSHRLVARGLSPRAAVLAIWGLTAVTGLAGVSLASVKPWQAALIGVQTIVILGVIGLVEYAGGWKDPRSAEARPESEAAADARERGGG